MKKLIFLLVAMSLTLNLYADEIITGFTDKDLPVLNEELRELRDKTGLSINGQVSGDITYYNGSDWTRLGAGTSGYILKTQGVGFAPIWLQTLPTANGGTGSTAAANAANGVCILNGSAKVAVANLPTGTAASDVVQLDGSAKLPAVDGSQLTNLPVGYTNNAWSWTYVIPNTGTEAGEPAHTLAVGMTYYTIFNFKFKKLPGVDTITYYARLRSSDPNTNHTPFVRLDINSLTAAVAGPDGGVFGWVSTTLDISSLTDNTIYDGKVELTNELDGITYISGIHLFGS